MTTSPTSTSELATRSARRWHRFSLRTLLIVVILVAVGLSLLMRHVHEQRATVQREKAAVAELNKLGGSVVYAIQAEPVLPSLPFWLRKILSDEGYQPVESVLYRANMAIVELGSSHPIEFEGLSSSNPQNTDAGLKHIGQLRAVRGLYMENRNFENAELEYLCRLASLKHVDLKHTPITDVGLEHIGRLTTLQSLDLCNTKITDAGLEHIAKLTGLQTLFMNNTQISDAGLEHIAKLTGLQTLFMDHTQISDAGLAKLKAALPQCRIYATTGLTLQMK
jgi:hypothetical protein